jgi:hypothetical protein
VSGVNGLITKKQGIFSMAAGNYSKTIENGSVIPVASNLNIQFKEITGKIIKE